VFGFKETLEPLGEVRASVARCDQGWAAKGKTLIPTAAARFYRTKRSYFVIGGRWNRLRYFRTLDNRPNLFLPFLSRKPIDAKEIPAPGPDASVPLDHLVCRCKRQGVPAFGACVELFATELREFTAFGAVQAPCYSGICLGRRSQGVCPGLPAG